MATELKTTTLVPTRAGGSDCFLILPRQLRGAIRPTARDPADPGIDHDVVLRSWLRSDRMRA